MIGTGALLIGGFVFLRCRSDVSGLSYCSTLGLVNPGAYKDRGIERSKNGDNAGAIGDFKKVIELNPKDADAFYRLGVISGDNQSDYDSGLNYLKKADAISPNENYKKKIAQFQNEKMRIATAELTRIIERNPSNANAYFKRGYAKFEFEDYQGAIADYSKAIAISPQDAIAYNNRCYALFLSKDYKKALPDCNKSISLDGNYPYTFDSRAEVKKALGDLKGACTDWKKAQELGFEDDIVNQDKLDKNFKENCS